MSYELEVYSSDAEAEVKVDGTSVVYVAPLPVVIPDPPQDDERSRLFAEHGERIYERIARGLKSDDVLDQTSGVRYVPWTDGYAVGYECHLPDGTSEFIYLNPSTSSDDGMPNVFVYYGTAGDIGHDGAEHFYVIGEENDAICATVGTEGQQSTCRYCDHPIERQEPRTLDHGTVGVWADAVGYGCSGRGNIGDVLPHLPTSTTTEERLEQLRGVLRDENISMGELLDLQDLGARGLIDAGDMELLEAAGVPEEDVRSGRYPEHYPTKPIAVTVDVDGLAPSEHLAVDLAKLLHEDLFQDAESGEPVSVTVTNVSGYDGTSEFTAQYPAATS